MNDIIKDFRNEGFTVKEMVLFGIVAPLVMIAMCLIASVFQH